MSSPNQLDLNVVGSSAFGRYSKISSENTFNMIISDDCLVPFAGYSKKLTIKNTGTARGLYSSSKANIMIAVIGDSAYRISAQLRKSKIGTLASSAGDVFIDENDNNQIIICDQSQIYVYSYADGSFIHLTSSFLGFTPGYITFQNGFFITPGLGTSQWRLSQINNGTVFPEDAQHVGLLQTKPDNVVACLRVPSRGNTLIVMGKTVSELWTDVGGLQFQYKRNTGLNIDYGCLSPATIATGDEFIIWLGSNEKSGPAIMMTDGGSVSQISNDGVNYKLAHLKHPNQSYAFLFKQDGHLFYQITFSNAEDNITILYDITTKSFFSLCSPDYNCHIARQVVYFNNKYYFVSFNDDNLYELSSEYTDADGEEIPRVRICKAIRKKDSTPFSLDAVSITIEQGDEAELRRVDLSVSTDGGASWGNIVGRELNPLGKRRGMLTYHNIGYANDFTLQFRFWGHGKFVIINGVAEIGL